MIARPKLNPHLTGFECIRCASVFAVGDHAEGCRKCLALGCPASVAPRYEALPHLDASRVGRSRFALRLPYSGGPSLGEGETPLVECPALAEELGLDGVAIKMEGANPTGSHKDRMSAQFVARALDRGARTVAAASSGNAGASLAAYAAAAGLDCAIVCTAEVGSAWRRAIERAGARLVVVADSKARWRLIAENVAKEGWFSATNFLDPPVGSEPFGVDGYKTLGYELAADPFARSADAVFVPTARGDVLWGIHRAFGELTREGRWASPPRLFAVEPFARIERVLAGEDPRRTFPGTTPMTSIGGGTVTYQTLQIVMQGGGSAVTVDAERAIADRLRLGRLGFDVELSSAAALTGLRVALDRGDKRIRRAVLVATSHGYKEAGP